MKPNCFIVLFLTITLSTVHAQDSGYHSMRWKEVATKMPEEWYGSKEAKAVAENVLLAQKAIGGWEKNKGYHQNLSDSEKAEIKAAKSKTGATFDNGATITE